MAYSGFQGLILRNKISKRFELCRYIIAVFFSKFLFSYAVCQMELRWKIKEKCLNRLHPNSLGIFLWMTGITSSRDRV
jgi:hypothetical protein